MVEIVRAIVEFLALIDEFDKLRDGTLAIVAIVIIIALCVIITTYIRAKSAEKQGESKATVEKQKSLQAYYRTVEASIEEGMQRNNSYPALPPVVIDEPTVVDETFDGAYSGSTSKVARRTILVGVAVGALVVGALVALLFVGLTLHSPFDDVSFGDEYFWAVKWAHRNNITNGENSRHFYPDNPCTHRSVILLIDRAKLPKPTVKFFAEDIHECTRGEFITYLWLAVEQPENLWKSPYEYYGRAIDWAMTKGITSAKSYGEFSPNKVCARWHAVMFLYNARSLLKV